YDGQGEDPPEVKLGGSLWGAAELNLGAARGGVGGGIFANIEFDLFDPDKDGRIRLQELAGNFFNQLRAPDVADRFLAPLAIFDVSGEITAEFFAYLKIKLLFWKVNKKWQFTEPITLADFNIDFYRPPILATELPNGDLILNMGEFAKDRLLGNTDDTTEHFYVADAGPGKVEVWAPSLEVEGYGRIDRSQAQTYSIGKGNYKGKIIALAGAGDDIIDLSEVNSGIGFDIDGGAGNDEIWTGDGNGVIRGGVGDDEIHAGSGSDVIYGDRGS
ncbi:unnamed protein product, partial [marine sediment metagenome]